MSVVEFGSSITAGPAISAAGRQRGPPQDARLDRPRRIVEDDGAALFGRGLAPASTAATASVRDDVLHARHA